MPPDLRQATDDAGAVHGYQQRPAGLVDGLLDPAWMVWAQIASIVKQLQGKPSPRDERLVLRLLAREGRKEARTPQPSNQNLNSTPPLPPLQPPATTTMADLRRRMQDQRAAIECRIAHARERTAATADAFSAALLSARSIANQTVSNRGIFQSFLFFSIRSQSMVSLAQRAGSEDVGLAQLNELKQQLRKLEADLAQTLSVQTSKRSKHKLMGDSILNSAATNEQLRSLAMDQRARRDEYVKAISSQLQAIESLEAETDAKADKKLEEAIMWYNKFLGFQVVGGEVVQCVPFADGSKELVKDLNCNNDLYKFVRTMRERFQNFNHDKGSRFRSIEHGL
ncbi:hypothetical protein BAE44_0002123, partial [Dichanthelium oligosanthes]